MNKKEAEIINELYELLEEQDFNLSEDFLFDLREFERGCL